MTRLLKPLSEWTEADVLSLITEGIEEGQRLDYKRELRLASDSSKAEAAKDASGMANAVGGLLIYGVEERKLQDERRIPVAPTPIQDGGIEAQLQDVLYSSVSPQLNLATKLVPVSSGGFFLLVRLQQRTGALHMVEGQNQHRYFLRAGLATRPMEAHEVETAFRALAAIASRIESELLTIPLIPRIAPTRSKHTESMAVEPDARPWVSVVIAPLDPGAELEMRTPTPYDYPLNTVPRPYLRDPLYIGGGSSYSLDASGYVSRFTDESGRLLRVLRLYRNGWCEWGYRYLRPPDDPDGTTIPGLVLIANVYDALNYFAGTYRDRNYFGRLRVWIRVDNPDNSQLAVERDMQQPQTPTDDCISYEIDTNVEDLIARPMRIVHAAMDRIWQGYGLTRCHYFSPEGELLRDPR